MRQFIIGIDEVGRGALAGPIVAVAVLGIDFSKERHILAKLKDSKLLSPSQREELFAILNQKLEWELASISSQQIDQIGIQAANVLVMEKALQKLIKKNKLKKFSILADYVGGAKKYQKSKLDINFIKHGDRLHPEISAASVLAKVWRDRLMIKLGKKFPHYKLASHKGYGSREHLKKLREQGPSLIHRLSFLKSLDS